MKKLILTIVSVIFVTSLMSQTINVKRSTVNKMSDVSSNIIFDEPKTDNEVARPDGYTHRDDIGISVQVNKNIHYTTRGGSDRNIIFDVPTIDVEQKDPRK